ncbi:MAG: hypothetical protein ACI4EU_08055 [Butyrivibrio sp.]
MKKIILILCLTMICLTGCSGKGVDDFFKSWREEEQSGSGIVGYTNNGAVNKKDMTVLEFERIHYGAATIQYEDRFLFAEFRGYEFPRLITSEEEWQLLQEKLNIDMEDIDFDEYVVFGDYRYDLWGEMPCIPNVIKEMAYSDQTLYYGWRTAENRCFEAVNQEDRLCGFDLVKIKRSDFPMEPRDVFGAAMYDEEQENKDKITVESGGYNLLY